MMTVGNRFQEDAWRNLALAALATLAKRQLPQRQLLSDKMYRGSV